MKTKLTISLCLLGVMSLHVYGQDAAAEQDAATTEATECQGLDPKEWRYPDDKSTATEKNALYSDLRKAERFEESIAALRWLFENAPDMNPSIYINGAKIFEALGDAAEETEVKYSYYDSALWCYDQRIHFFCDKDGKVLDRKAFYNFKFFYKDPKKYQDIYGLYQEVLASRGNNFSTINIVPFMTATARLYDPIGQIEGTDVLAVYDALSEVLKAKGEAGVVDAEKLKKSQEKLDGLLAGVLPMDATFIEENFCSKIAEDPNNVELARKVVAYSLSNKATDNACFIQAAKIVYHVDPTDAMARIIADKHLALDELDSAISWYENSIGLMEDNIKKSEIYYSIANIYRTRGFLSSARSAALKGIEEDPSNNKLYVTIGDIYQSAFQGCKGGVNIVHDRAVFIAAYNWYRKAGDSNRMASVREQFPSKEEIFQYNMEIGQSYTVGCWINETVSIQARN